MTLHFIEHHTAGTADRAELSSAGVADFSQARVFNLFCNGRTVIDGLDIVRQVGENHPLVRKIKGLEPNRGWSRTGARAERPGQAAAGVRRCDPLCDGDGD